MISEIRPLKISPESISFSTGIPEIDKIFGKSIPNGSVITVFGSDYDGIRIFLKKISSETSSSDFRLLAIDPVFSCFPDCIDISESDSEIPDKFSGISKIPEFRISDLSGVPDYISKCRKLISDSVSETLFVFVFWDGTACSENVMSFIRFSDSAIEFRREESGTFIERYLIIHRICSGNAVDKKIGYTIKNGTIIIEQMKRVF